MKRQIIQTTAVFLIQILFICKALGASNQQELNNFIDALAASDKAMLGVDISRNGRTVYENYSGYADVALGFPLNRYTEFRAGSITKTFTAVMIFQLVEQGELSLSTKLSEFFPEIPNAELITIQNLLNHSSGLYNYTDDPSFPLYAQERHSKQAMLEWIGSYNPVFYPGATHQYSNSNYILLGYIIEHLSNLPYARVMWYSISRPVGIYRTTYGKDLNTRMNHAQSYYFNTPSNQWEAVPAWDLSIAGGAGALVSTPRDLNRFMRALFSDALVSPDSLAEMTNTVGNFGSGLMPVQFYEFSGFGHTGGIEAFQSAAFHFPDQDLSIALIISGNNYSFDRVLFGIMSLYFGMPFDYSDLTTP